MDGGKVSFLSFTLERWGGTSKRSEVSYPSLILER